MLLAEISSTIFQALRARLSPDQIILIMDAAQRIAFDRSSEAFKIWTEALTINHTLTFSSSLAYTPAITTDIGKTVTGLTSGATGTLVSYDNSTRIWIILLASSSTDYRDGEGVGVTLGTGLGFLAASESFNTYIGPYSAPTDPPLRKIWGITRETDARIFGTTDAFLLFPMNDFNFVPRKFNPQSLLQPGREDNVNFTFTFAQAPTFGAPYRWVYWRDAPTINGTSDESQLLIPPTYHFYYVNACIKMAQTNLAGEDVDPKMLDAFFKPWWNQLDRAYTPMGNTKNQTLNPRGPSWSII